MGVLRTDRGARERGGTGRGDAGGRRVSDRARPGSGTGRRGVGATTPQRAGRRRYSASRCFLSHRSRRKHPARNRTWLLRRRRARSLGRSGWLAQ
ncbi:hypothetical protein TOK_3532 [Pseudonocardia sp. N23]|nr:hypothetical protein TOK_3532 [Pseudonocardia sp. N23]